MPEPGLEARIRFLDDSARILQTLAPSTSAHLMLERNNIAQENEKLMSRLQVDGICKACGTIMIPDISSKAVTVGPHMTRRKKTSVTADNLNAEKTECLVCHRVVRSQRPKAIKSMKPPSSLQSSRGPASNADVQTRHAKSDIEKPTSSNANSRKRARTRKQGGLQALLERSKEKDVLSSGSGLNLLDFMKQT